MLFNYYTPMESGPRNQQSRPELSPGTDRAPDVPSYQFRHIDPEADLELLQAATPYPERISHLWLHALDECIEIGSRHLSGRGEETLSERNLILQKRWQYEVMLGLRALRRPRHGSHSEERHPRLGVLPDRSFAALRELTVILGTPHAAIAAARRKRELLGASPERMNFNLRFGQRLLNVLGWEGDARDIMQEEPQLLGWSTERLALLGRLAASQKDSRTRSLKPSIVGYRLLYRPEIHLLTYIQSEQYVFGRNLPKGEDATDVDTLLANRLADPAVREAVGPRVLKAYFRVRPPSLTQQAKDKDLRTLTPIRKRMAKEVADEDIPIKVTGKEAWLAHTAMPSDTYKRKKWLRRVNRHIALADDRPANAKSGNYRKIQDRRRSFFRLLGWAQSSHEFYEAWSAFADWRPSLVPPRKVVDIMNVLDAYVERVEEIIPRIFSIFAIHTPQELKVKLDLISQGASTQEVLTVAPTILFERLDKIDSLIGATEWAELVRRNKNPPPVITGDEPWLASTTIPSAADPKARQRWLKKINTHIVLGSIRLSARATYSVFYKQVPRHRARFYKMFGWSDPQHPAYKKYRQFSKTPNGFPSPWTVVQNLNVFSRAGLPNVSLLIASSVGNVTQKPETLKAKLDAINQRGVSVERLLAMNIRTLLFPLGEIIERADKAAE